MYKFTSFTRAGSTHKFYRYNGAYHRYCEEISEISRVEDDYFVTEVFSEFALRVYTLEI